MTEHPLSTEMLDIQVLFRKIWDLRWVALTFLGVGSAVTLFVVMVLPSTYRAEALTIVADSAYENGGSIPAGIGSLASMVGVSIPAMSNDRATIVVETLRGHTFLAEFIHKRKLKPYLFAAKEWDQSTKSIRWDTSVYDPEREVWTRQVPPPSSARPSDQEAVEKFREVLDVSHDSATGLIRVSLITPIPEISYRVAEWLVEDINGTLRGRDQYDASRRLRYLQDQLKETSSAELRRALFALIERELWFLMLTEVQEDYALKVIDKPFPPELPTGPNRPLIAIVGLLLTFVATFFLVIVILLTRAGRERAS